MYYLYIMKKLINQITLDLEKLRKGLSIAKATFCEQAEYDNSDDCIYEIPRCYSVTKHGFYCEWAILRIENGIAYCGGIGEDYGEMLECSLSELNDSEIISIANELI